MTGRHRGACRPNIIDLIVRAPGSADLMQGFTLLDFWSSDFEQRFRALLPAKREVSEEMDDAAPGGAGRALRFLPTVFYTMS